MKHPLNLPQQFPFIPTDRKGSNLITVFDSRSQEKIRYVGVVASPMLFPRKIVPQRNKPCPQKRFLDEFGCKQSKWINVVSKARLSCLQLPRHSVYIFSVCLSCSYTFSVPIGKRSEAITRGERSSQDFLLWPTSPFMM